MQFESKAQAISWIINNQLGRRNINSFDKIILEFKKNSIITGKSVSLMTREMRKDIGRETKKGGNIATIKGKTRDILNQIKEIEKRQLQNKRKNY